MYAASASGSGDLSTGGRRLDHEQRVQIEVREELEGPSAQLGADERELRRDGWANGDAHALFRHSRSQTLRLGFRREPKEKRPLSVAAENGRRRCRGK